ncbi:hypothetical protein HBH98_248040 [Parastagonospora nodorum]|nr:hypothetical protein HBH53_253530 [Parastagonospora nodorum]KAH3956200.1 hypothetical protein HBH51_248580 [Parastagonospora nodorum]KAH4223577.1 hypothetical protein HBI05_247710 [Parastagonospora nodorum]KAH4333512.1 hypothetical protein HBH98_248040 [Parastagonospora nodorum]KAH4368410.1 hypothetical protein HBH99_247900 [Parastagonospora nodorum]
MPWMRVSDASLVLSSPAPDKLSELKKLSIPELKRILTETKEKEKRAPMAG